MQQKSSAAFSFTKSSHWLPFLVSEIQLTLSLLPSRSILILSSHLRVYLCNCLGIRGLPTNILYISLFFFTLVTWILFPPHRTLLNLIVLVILKPIIVILHCKARTALAGSLESWVWPHSFTFSCVFSCVGRGLTMDIPPPLARVSYRMFETAHNIGLK
jgi:hypothetical protein